MKKLFIESREFTNVVQQFFHDEAYAAFQTQLLAQPDKGRVMPGCGGLRKIRVGDPTRRKGKRGGARIIYLHVPEANWIYLLDIYGKDEKGEALPRRRC
jgi:putative transcriptional regulator